MRAYLVTVKDSQKYAGNQSEARALQKELLEKEGLGPRAKGDDISIDEVEIPTSKTELIGFLNEMLDPEEDEDDD